jgi:hypothetical protein
MSVEVGKLSQSCSVLKCKHERSSLMFLLSDVLGSFSAGIIDEVEVT